MNFSSVPEATWVSEGIVLKCIYGWFRKCKFIDGPMIHITTLLKLDVFDV